MAGSPTQAPPETIDERGSAPRSSRDAVIAAARRMFAERGYAAVSIRDVAAEAGVSPALVIKHVGTKDAMFREATSFEPVPVLIAEPVEQLGEAIVRRVVEAHRQGRPGPLTRAVVLILPAPDPGEVRQRLDAAYLKPLVERLGGTPDAQRRAEAALAAATGLSVSLRCFKHHGDPAYDDELVARYGAAVQALLDG